MKNRILLFLVLLATGSLWGQTSVTYTFTTGVDSGLSSEVDLDTNISFRSYQNSSGTAPAVLSNRLRLYQNATKGGSIKVFAKNDVTITKVVFNVDSSGAGDGPKGYSVDSATETGTFSAGNSTNTIEEDAIDFVEYYSKGTSSSTRTYVVSFTVTYESTPSGDHTITVTQPTGGSISPDTIGVEDGEDQSFTATPESSCYTFSHWVVDASNSGSTNPYEFTNVTADHTITAVFNAVGNYTITASAGANGSISPSGATSVACGANQAYTITANSGYAVADVLVNGLSVGTVSSYDFTNVTANQTISATFEEYVGPCLEQLNFTSTPTDWAVDTVTYASNEAVFGGNNGSLTTIVISNPNMLTFDLRRTANSNVKSLIVEVSTTTQDGSYSIVDTFDHDNTASGSTTPIIVDLSAYASYSTVFIRFRKASSTASPWYIKNLTVTCGESTPEPELTLTQNSNSIAHNGTYDFGNQLVATPSEAVTFTIENTGNADLNIGTIALSGANASDFSVTQVANATLEEDETTTFTVTFTPSSLGSKSATVSIPNDDNTNYTFTVSGEGSYSSDSDITTNALFTYPTNIDYSAYQTSTITNTSNSIGVYQFNVRDGGDTPDSDALSTTLTALAFSYTGSANTIRSAALFNGNAMLTSGVVSANGITFSGLSIVATDGASSDNITLRVTFTQTVLDNDKLVFTVTSATADVAGSVFGSANASGAFSDNHNGNDRNRIEVTADRLAFVQQPSNANINVAMTPAVTVSANDSLGNRDLDFTGLVSISSYGDLTGDPVELSAINGLATFNNLVHTTAQTDLLLEASYTTWSVESTAFNVSEIVIPNNAYRTTSDGTWPSGSATWERWNGNSWSTATPGANTTDLLIIRHTVESRAAFAATGGVGTKMLVENGGTFNGGHNCTFNSLTIQNGGVFSVNNPAVTLLSGTGTLTVENGGKLIFNSSTLDSTDGIFAGIEEFQPESIIEVRNWHFNTGAGSKNLINSNGLHYVDLNSAGYHFGNIIVNAPSMSGAFELIQNTLAGSNVKLCNNFTVLSNASNIFLVNSATSTTMGGNLTVNTGASSKFSFSANTSANATHTIKGNIVLESGLIDLNQNNSGASGNSIVNLEGNLTVNGGTLMNTDSNDVNTVLNFKGDNVEQTVSINPASNNSNIPFIINTGAYVKIINHNFKLGNNSKVTVKSGGTLDFGFNDSTALNLTGNGVTGTGFTSEQGSYLKISSPDGIVSTSGNVGNIQTNTSPFISPIGTFHYIGKQNQVTGNGFGTTSTGKAVIVEMDQDNLVLTPSVSLNITNGTNANINGGNGGVLDIRKGRFVETETGYVAGTNGHLKMDVNTYYEIVKSSDSSSDVIPRMSGNYEVTGGQIHLSSAGNQTLRGGKDYNDLTFSGGAIKSVSNSSTPNIEGMVAVMANTTLDVSGRSNNGFGKAVTEFLMDENSKFIVDGSAVRPQMGGYYLLDPTSTIEFTGTAATEIRLAPSYANLIISGTNVTAGSTPTGGLTIQDATTFTIKDGATFKVSNPQGMYGNTTTAIKNSPVITFDLELNSTVEYNGTGTDQQISKLSVAYGNLTIKGANSVKRLPNVADGNVVVRKDISIDAAAALDIETNKTLLVGEKFNNSGEVVVRNSANFIQQHAGLDQNTNTGIFKAERITRPMNRLSYTYWGAPVSTTINNAGIKWFVESVTNSGNFNTQVASNQLTQIYKWNTTTQNWDNAIGSTTIAADGFIAKAPNNFSSAVNNRKEVLAEFQGAPFNGTISKAIVPNTGGSTDPYTNAKMTFMSNPYPSAINIDKFLLEYGDGLIGSTPVVIPTIYLWTHASLPTAGVYSASDFATYTLLGGTATEPDNDGVSPISLTPEGKLASGQGFFIRGTEVGGTVELKNDYRYSNADTGYNNQQFFRVATDEQLFERHRFWLNLKGGNSQFKQTLIGYSDIATDGVDGLDGSYYEGGNPTNLYTILDNHPFVIQAFALPFDQNDVIPLGFKVGTAGDYTIALDNFDGLFEENIIYIKDNLTGVVHNLKDGDYEFTSAVGNFTDRFKIIFKPYECSDFTIWNGTSWSNGEPDETKKVIIEGNLTLTEDMSFCELTINSGILTLNTEVNLTVVGEIVNTQVSENFVVQDRANLIQVADVQNTGAIKVYKNSAPIKRLDYTIWSSPVSEQNIQGFSPFTLPSRIYTYDSATDKWTNSGFNAATDSFDSGIAYMFRAPNNYPESLQVYQGLFEGKPNNGTISLDVNSHNYIGVGNPYPSNIRIDGSNSFKSFNQGIGTLNFWTNVNPWSSELQNYTGNNWATYSTLGATTAANDNPNNIPNEYLPVGQGFVIEAPSVNRIVFNNDMRTENQGVFFRIAEEDKHRFWLNLSADNQELNTILLGYAEGATQGYDFGLDAKLFGYSGSSLYSLIEENTDVYSIQGRSLPFDDNDIIALGFKAVNAGVYTISLSDFDGMFDQLDIYLKDNLLNLEHNLKSDNYTFIAESGEFTNRFEVVFRQTLSNNPIVLLDSNWVVYSNENNMNIESLGFEMKDVYVYDMLGREVYSSKNINDTKHTVNNVQANQILLVKIISKNGESSVKKFQN